MSLKRWSGILKAAGFPILIITLLGAAFFFREEIYTLFSSAENLEVWIAAKGKHYPLIFIGLQFFQVLIFVIPGEIPQMAGGYLFGPLLGMLYSSAGIMLGSIVNYYLGALLGIPFVYRVLGSGKAARLQHWVTGKKGKLVLFILFLVPGIPKDALCYLAGISEFGILLFLGLSFLGRLPGIAGSSFLGGAVAEERWVLAFIVFSAACILLVAGVIFKKEIENKIDGLMHKGRGEKDEPKSGKDGE